MKTRSNNSACVNIFLELLLTNLYRHYFKMNATSMMYDSYYWSCIDFYTVITYTLTIMKQPPDQNPETAAGSVLKIFCKSHRKIPVLESFFYNAAKAFEPATSLKWDSWGICEILKSTYFEKHLWTAVFVYRLLHHILIYTIHYSTRFSFLQQLLYHAIKTIKQMTREAVSFEEVFHWTNLSLKCFMKS